MEGFYYSSSSTHGVMTPNGKKVKRTNVTVENGKGTLTMTVQDNDGTHSDTRVLSKNEVSNIKKHKFMPNLFRSASTNIKNLKLNSNSAKNNTKKGRSRKQGTRKHK